MRMSSVFQLCLVQVTIGSKPQQQSMLGHSSSVPWEQAKGPFLYRPSSSVHRLLLFPAWLRWSWGWISWQGGGQGRGGEKAKCFFTFPSPSRKSEKAFRLSSPCRPCSYTHCLCLLNFPIISPVFSLFFFFLLPHSWWNRLKFDRRLHLPSDVC